MHSVEPNSECLSYNARFHFAIHPKNQVLNSKIVGSVFVYDTSAIQYPTLNDTIPDTTKYDSRPYHIPYNKTKYD